MRGRGRGRGLVIAAASLALLAPAAEAAARGPAEGEVSLHLGSAVREDAAALLAAEDWNRAGRVPLRGSFARTLSEPLALRLREGAAGVPALLTGFLSVSRATGALSARARIVVDGASATRLHLAVPSPAPDATVVLRDGAGALVSEIELSVLQRTTGGWLPPVRGEETVLDVLLRGADEGDDLRLVVDRVTEFLGRGALGTQSVLLPSDPPAPACLVDAMCVEDPVLVPTRNSAALLYFNVGSDGFLCSGGLIRSDATPDAAFFATANHCINETVDLGSIIFFWDFRSESCGARPPDAPFDACAWCPGGEFPKSYGATILATKPDVDFTLLALGGPAASLVGPDGARRAAFSPTSAVVGPGALQHRWSFPLGLALKYSAQTILQGQVAGCARSGLSFSISRDVTGRIEPGSSGSITFGNDLKMTGTLFAACGDVYFAEPCRDPIGYGVIDGRPFAAAAATFDPWLAGCAYPLSHETVDFEEGGGTHTLRIDAKAGCAWTAASEASWTSASPASGDGAATITLTAPANTTGRSRVGTVRAGFHLVKVAQYGADCLASATPVPLPLFGPQGGSVTLALSAPSGCSWQVGPLPAWLTATPASGRGDGMLSLTASKNTSRAFRTHALDLIHARDGSASAAAHTAITVNQVRSLRTRLDAP